MTSMFWNAFIIALREIRRNLTRAFLTVLGVVIGVAAVITMVTLGSGATEALKQGISKLGNNLLTLRPGQGWGPSAAPLFSATDVDMIRNQVPGIRHITPMSNTNVQAIYGEEARQTDVQGTYPEYFPIGNWKIASGRFFEMDELNEGAPVAVIGETIKKELFNGRDPLGEKIRLLNTAVTVIGVTEVKGQAGWGDDLDDNIIIPITTLQSRLNGQMFKQNVNQIMISTEDGYPTDAVMADITSLMRERRNLARTVSNNFSVTDTRQIAEVMSSSVKTMTGLLGAVAGVSLLVGGIGIMNIMLVSVTERTREIGIRMSIGARAREVMLQFLVEAVTLSCVGGLSGIGLAYGLCYVLSPLVGAPFTFDPKINIIAVIFSAAIGVLFGFMPARRAAKLDPIEALRHE
ncbi:ABC transporter permease [Luteolibacter sp. GHJ8]|uniref:ABC transporter permease n=2 Tax=Luteolibacter rhizosphaerae TaxID=2989719 RepID=A0ABT3G347_9BACT|nr:ABC transporter permease [Luteolibacter rhizosphaerae]